MMYVKSFIIFILGTAPLSLFAKDFVDVNDCISYAQKYSSTYSRCGIEMKATADKSDDYCSCYFKNPGNGPISKDISKATVLAAITPTSSTPTTNWDPCLSSLKVMGQRARDVFNNFDPLICNNSIITFTHGIESCYSSEYYLLPETTFEIELKKQREYAQNTLKSDKNFSSISNEKAIDALRRFQKSYTDTLKDKCTVAQQNSSSSSGAPGAVTADTKCNTVCGGSVSNNVCNCDPMFHDQFGSTLSMSELNAEYEKKIANNNLPGSSSGIGNNTFASSSSGTGNITPPGSPNLITNNNSQSSSSGTGVSIPPTSTGSMAAYNDQSAIVGTQNNPGGTTTYTYADESTREVFPDGSSIVISDGNKTFFDKNNVQVDANGKPIAGGGTTVAGANGGGQTQTSSAGSSGQGGNPNNTGAGCRYDKWRGYSCEVTENAIENTRAISMVTQALGTTMTQIAGQQATQQANLSGKASDAYRGAADSQKTAANMELISGATNTIMAMNLMKHGSRHKQSIATGVTAEYNKRQAKLQQDYQTCKSNPNTASTCDTIYEAKFDKLETDYAGAKGEQNSKATMAKGTGLITMIQGVKQLSTGMMLKDAAKQQNAYADRLDETAAKEKCVLNPSDPSCPGNGDGDHETYCQLYPSAPSCLNANGGSSGGPWDNGDGDQSGLEINTDNPNLWGSSGIGSSGDGSPKSLDMMGDNSGPAGLTPGNFTDAPGGAGGRGPGGGGGANVGGVSGAGGAGGAGEDPKSQYANGFEGKDKYDSAGVMKTGGGGGAGAKGAGADAGLDLNSLLAKFLPGEEEKKDDNGILKFGEEGNRSPAGEGSFLDKNANIFERIHKTYQDKNGRGIVGI